MVRLSGGPNLMTGFLKSRAENFNIEMDKK